MKTNLIEQLTKERNAVVMNWDVDMKQLRKAREDGLAVDWELWDKLTKEMQIATAIIDQKIFDAGGMY